MAADQFANALALPRMTPLSTPIHRHSFDLWNSAVCRLCCLPGRAFQVGAAAVSPAEIV